jgi:uncharacterized membrane protein YgaE (UPF0421/DUF939 family)
VGTEAPVPSGKESEEARAAPGRFAALIGAQAGPPIGASYALRTASSAAIAFGAHRVLGPQVGLWAVVSAVVVIQPEVHASVGSAALRVVANVVGAGVGATAGAVLGAHPVAALCSGMVAVAILCRALRIDAAARSASVTVAIVLLRGPESVLGSSEMRVLGVLAGCAVALAVTVAAARIERLFARWSRG